MNEALQLLSEGAGLKEVDRASTTTVAALRTAVTVSQAMANQRLVLEQVTALNTTTAGLIDSTGILELVAFLEGEFAIQMADAEIVPANLDSIKAIVGYVERKAAKQAAA